MCLFGLARLKLSIPIHYALISPFSDQWLRERDILKGECAYSRKEPEKERRMKPKFAVFLPTFLFPYSTTCPILVRVIRLNSRLALRRMCDQDFLRTLNLCVCMSIYFTLYVL